MLICAAFGLSATAVSPALPPPSLPPPSAPYYELSCGKEIAVTIRGSGEGVTFDGQGETGHNSVKERRVQILFLVEAVRSNS